MAWPLDQLNTSTYLPLRLYEEKQVHFDVSEAGPGQLGATIKAPNGATLPHKLSSSNGSTTTTTSGDSGGVCTLLFAAMCEGDYRIYLTWANHPLPHMPLIASTNASAFNNNNLQNSNNNNNSNSCNKYQQAPQPLQQADMQRIEITGMGVHEALMSQEAEFVVDGSRVLGEIYGRPEIRLAGTRCDIEVRVAQLGRNIYRCTYVPQLPGAYLLNVKWCDRQVGDSPYKVNVGMNSDPAKVIVSGDGIKMGMLGQDVKALIDTRRAGPGELTAHCMGAQKVAFCEFFDHKDGTFTLYVKPQEAGKHVLQIKYNDEHVPGSPFIIRIAGPPDATKCRVVGPGVCHGVLTRYRSKFVCDTKGAGAGQLTVRVRGPKAAFRVEMQRENAKDRAIACKYDPVEPGNYQINVKWSGEHVPGSPFNVHIFATDDELENFLRLNPNEAYALQKQQLQHQQLNI